MVGPGDETPARAGGHGQLRASHAEREHVIGTLKAAYVYGLVTKDEPPPRRGISTSQGSGRRTSARQLPHARKPRWLSKADPRPKPVSAPAAV